MNPNTPREIETWNMAFDETDGVFNFITKETKIHDDNSLDRQYKYILIKPRTGNSMVNDVVGILDDKDLDTYTAPTDNIDECSKGEWRERREHDQKVNEALCKIKKRYKFPTNIERYSLPGFSARLEYNDYYVYAYFDDNCKNSDAPLNPTADVLLMTKGMRGNLILVAYKLDRENENTEVVPMSLRDIFWYAQHTYHCGTKDCVPERAHFENIQRLEVSNWLSSNNFRTLSL